ncbi:MAG: signal recognition particle-docking protein FtsY [Candidatus Pelagibacter sp. TMED118]|nr:MAG: signal recognition particle-docking protein FtsY [Candidatus Pelagibacter sp. TMED118]
MGIFEKFKLGFKKSADKISIGLREIIIKEEIDDKKLNEIEEFLISSDVGVEASAKIKTIISERKIDPNLDPIVEINKILKEFIINLMLPLEKKNFFNRSNLNDIILISGVNGAGKTTTIGKIGKIFKDNENKVAFAACDTFRAAAIEQLEEWSRRIGVEIIKSSPGSDPAAVAYKAAEQAKSKNINKTLLDTAGRLQNKKNLMEEYKKIANVTKKIILDSPHEVILVLDATSGQNIINQVDEFNKIIPITGIIMTKLDGTARGGILIAIAQKFKLPIIALGLGEKIDDLQIFDSSKFADAFLEAS